METESCHSNQSCYLSLKKNVVFFFFLFLQTVSVEKIFKDFFFLENLLFLGPQRPIKISDQDEGHLKRKALLNKHFSKNKIQIPPIRQQK